MHIHTYSHKNIYFFFTLVLLHQAVNTLCSASTPLATGGYRIEYTVETHLWSSAVQHVEAMLRFDPETQIHNLIGKFAGHEQLDEVAVLNEPENNIAEMLSFQCWKKSVSIEMYSKVCKIALQLAVDRNLFSGGLNLSDALTQEKQFLLVDLYNLLGVYGWEVSKKYVYLLFVILVVACRSYISIFLILNDAFAFRRLSQPNGLCRQLKKITQETLPAPTSEGEGRPLARKHQTIQLQALQPDYQLPTRYSPDEAVKQREQLLARYQSERKQNTAQYYLAANLGVRTLISFPFIPVEINYYHNLSLLSLLVAFII